MKEQIKKIEQYIPGNNKDYDIDDRQREAVEKLKLIPRTGFSKMLNDIVNEIERRQNKEGVSVNQNTKKFQKLSEQKFVNLLIDIVCVYNSLYRETEISKNDDASIDTTALTEANNETKNLSEYKYFFDNNEVDYYEKMLLFIKISNVPENLKLKIKKLTEENKKKQIDAFFDIFKSPLDFITGAKNYLKLVKRTKAEYLLNDIIEDFQNDPTVLSDNEIREMLLSATRFIISSYSYRERYLASVIARIINLGINYIREEKNLDILKNEVSKALQIADDLNILSLNTSQKTLEKFSVGNTSKIYKEDFSDLLSVLKLLIINLSSEDEELE